MKKVHESAKTSAWMEIKEETVCKDRTGEGAQTRGAKPPSPPPSSCSLMPKGPFQGSNKVRLRIDPLLDSDEEIYTEANKEPTAHEFAMSNLKEKKKKKKSTLSRKNTLDLQNKIDRILSIVQTTQQ